MGNIFENLTEAIADLKKSVTKDLEEIRTQKLALQQMQEAIRMNGHDMKYVRDAHCLILSAPKVIIGNVDSTGRLFGGGSSVLIRGGKVSTEATGAVGVGGTITNRATTIQNIAVDPGIDGLENVVFPNSKITNQARSITLQTNDEKGCFSADVRTSSGINILSDSGINIAALAQNKVRKAVIDGKVESYKKASAAYAEAAEKYSKKLDAVIEGLKKIIGTQGELNGSDEDLAMNYEEVYGARHAQFKRLEAMLYPLASDYFSCLSLQAEAERSVTALNATKKAIDEAAEDFDNNPTAGHISMRTESMSITSTDGDGSIRANQTAGLTISVPHLSVSSFDKDGALIKDSSINLNTETFDLCTSSPAYDDKEKRDTGQIPAGGSVTVTSKAIAVQTIDNELTSDGIKEKALTEGGTIALRGETMTLLATDTEGKSSGKLAINAKTVNIAAMDVDKDSREDKEMAADSKLTVLAEKTFVGTTEKSDLVQLAAKKVSLIGKETAELQQDGKAVVTASGGNLTAGGSKVELDGDTAIKGGAKIDGEVKAPKVSADQVDVSQAFKSPNINDTMGAGVPAPATTPSAKLKEEEAKTK